MNPYNHNHPPPQSSLPQPNTMPHGLHQQLPSLATANNYPPPLPHHQQQQQHLPSMAPPSATASYGDVPSNYAPGPMQDRQQQQPQPSPTASTPRAPSPGQLERTAEALRPHSHVVNGRRYTSAPRFLYTSCPRSFRPPPLHRTSTCPRGTAS